MTLHVPPTAFPNRPSAVLVLDAVVHHLHEVTGAVVADMGHARLSLGDGGDRCQDRTERRPRLIRPAGHQRRAQQRALLAAGDSHPDEVDPGLRSEEHTSELQSLMRSSYAVFCLKKK